MDHRCRNRRRVYLSADPGVGLVKVGHLSSHYETRRRPVLVNLTKLVKAAAANPAQIRTSWNEFAPENRGREIAMT